MGISSKCVIKLPGGRNSYKGEYYDKRKLAAHTGSTCSTSLPSMDLSAQKRCPAPVYIDVIMKAKSRRLCHDPAVAKRNRAPLSSVMT
jgi:hypothetical protein